MPAANAATRLTLTTRGDGSVDLRARLPEATASRLKTYLEAFTAPRHQDPGTQARTRIPHERRMGQAFCALLDRTKRLSTAAQRQALTLHHRECRADGCTVPSTWCEAHHRIHDPGYSHQRHPDGTVRFHRRT